MRLAALLLIVLALAACDPTEENFRLVTLAGGDSVGLSLRELPKATLHSIGLGYGLGVVRLGTAGERAGLRIGDVIYGVNQSRIYSVEEFSQAIAKPSDGRVGLLVRRGKTDLYVPMDLGVGRHPDIMPPRRTTDTLLRT
jgi:membrane-associated protease RseP (regulator of RpoE activity)